MRPEMSWLSRKTGRPEEEGGHTRKNISVDAHTGIILQVADNASVYIEYCVRACTPYRQIEFWEPASATNDDENTFKTAATFDWTPVNPSNNAIMSTLLRFQYRCAGKGFKFRMVANDIIVLSSERLTSVNWASSPLYTNHDFNEKIQAFCNQSSFTIRFEFIPAGSTDAAYVKDLSVTLEVIDGLPMLSP